ncbi:hypothetical protein GW930_03270 [Candidatus Saccharibacteria bacterium]|nr:hypothetical protein [Candidatus Saccharibacteria bacterium]
MQRGYSYERTALVGRDFPEDFKPELTPKEMLTMGVFGGVYMRDCRDEFPESWYENAKLAADRRDPACNYYGVLASQPLSEWQRKGWVQPQDPRGWFQWYCRYYMGRRTDDDTRQIKRWRAMRRHVGQIKANCEPGDEQCRPRQRQVLLQWAYDSRKL